MLNLVIALPAEARPLISHYNLKVLDIPGDFRIWADQDLHLILSGPGKTAAAAAVAHLHFVLSQDGPTAWLNIGIAGHGSEEIGTPLIAREIVDQETNQSYRPTFTFSPPCATTTIISVDSPEERYPRSCAYDMEASGFFPAANSLSPDRTHCLKIVSDNPHSSHYQLSGKRVKELVNEHLQLIDDLISELKRTEDGNDDL